MNTKFLSALNSFNTYVFEVRFNLVQRLKTEPKVRLDYYDYEFIKGGYLIER